MDAELGGGERCKARVRKAMNMGSGDASDVMDAEQCIISIMKGFGDYLDNGHSSGEGPTYRDRQLAFAPPVSRYIHTHTYYIYTHA